MSLPRYAVWYDIIRNESFIKCPQSWDVYHHIMETADRDYRRFYLVYRDGYVHTNMNLQQIGVILNRYKHYFKEIKHYEAS